MVVGGKALVANPVLLDGLHILTNFGSEGRLCRCVRRPQHLAHWVRLLRRGINLEITWFRQIFS